MFRYIAIIAIILIAFIPLSAHGARAVSENTPPIVEAQWLKEHLGQKNLVLLHIGNKKEYDEGHIPGARFISSGDVSLSPDESDLSLQLAGDEKLKDTFEKLGVSNDSRIILYYGKDWVTPTTRIYFTLDAMGFRNNTSILDGGMPAWTAAGGKLTTDVPEPAQGKLVFKTNRDAVATADWLSSNLANDSVKIIDARDPRFYDGTSVGGYKRGGHIPGARNIPYSTVVDDKNFFKSESDLRKMFSDAGVGPDDTVVTYCHIGQQASLDYFAARTLGYKVKLYDGSFQEWSARTDLPLEDPFVAQRTSNVTVVGPDWLAAHLNDDDLRVLDVRLNVYDYFKGHVPNAVHLADAAMRAPRDGYPTQYLDPFMTGRLLMGAGVLNSDKVAVYSDGDGVLGATMMVYILERLGHHRIFFIDGGWSGYKDGRKTSQEYPSYKPSPYDIRDNDGIKASVDDVKASIGKPGVKFIDARPPNVFSGEAKIWIRNGHIPGAVNIPWKLLVEADNSHKFRSAAEMRKVYADRGISEKDDIIVYCGTSREASLEFLVLKHVLNFPKVRLYEGSWAEYSNHKDLPVDIGS